VLFRSQESNYSPGNYSPTGTPFDNIFSVDNEGEMANQLDLYLPSDYDLPTESDIRTRFGPPDINPSEITYNEETDFIGEGVFGKVFKARCRSCAVAVKVPINQNLSNSELADFKREVSIVSSIFHPNVVLFMGACMQPGNIKMVTERMTTDLENLLHSPKGKGLPAFAIFKMAKDAAKGMNWLHGINNIIHRDLKPSSLLIDNNYNVKVSDFGFSELLKSNQQTKKDSFGPRGTAIWMAPEVMKGEEFGKTVDVYSFGLILWEMFTFEDPFRQYEVWDEFFKAIAVRKERPMIPKHAPPSLSQLISTAWADDRNARPLFPSVIFQLDEVLVDLAIGNTHGANFWKKHFLFNQPTKELEEFVKWPDFVKVLQIETKVHDSSKFDVLYPYLAVFASDKRVTIHSFSNTLMWFGYFFVPERAEHCLNDVHNLLRESWFHGSIDQLEAEGRLHFQPTGSFLIRMSKTKADYPFTLSLKQRHLRIKKTMSPTGTPLFYLPILDPITGKTQDVAYKSLRDLVHGVWHVLGLTVGCPKMPAPDGYVGDS